MYEHLEKILEASFKREYEQDENVVRSLPFFATALGVVVAIFTQIITRMPTYPIGRVIVVALLCLSAVAFVRILWCLFQTVRVREYLMPPNEIRLVAWCEDLRDFYFKEGKTESEANDLVTADLRMEMVASYAASANHNRIENAQKTRHRTDGLTWLVILMALATLSVAVIFVENQVLSSDVESETDVQSSSAASRPQQPVSLGRIRPVHEHQLQTKPAKGNGDRAGSSVPGHPGAGKGLD